MNALVDAVAILSSCQPNVLSTNWFVSETSTKRAYLRLSLLRVPVDFRPVIIMTPHWFVFNSSPEDITASSARFNYTQQFASS